ncbi:MAG: S9 family peptidase [Acidimicrobiales bacterium]
MPEVPVREPPTAKRIHHERTFHGDTVVDDRHWILDRDDPDTLALLEAENAYADAMTAHLAPLREQLFAEFKGRILETDLSVPVKRGPWWYLARTEEGSQYPRLCRRSAPDDEHGEQILLDGNELAGDSPHFAFGVVDVSPDHRVVAYSTDHAGDERFVLRFRDLDAGADLPDEVLGTYYAAAWAADSTTFFYVTVDDAHRPHRLWRHRLGTLSADDELLHEEGDERFFLSVSLTRSEGFVVLELASKVTSEVHVLDAANPLGEFRVVEARRQGVEYALEHQGDRFVILSNDGHPDFAVFEAPIASPGRSSWRAIHAPGPGTRVTSLHAFAGHLVVHERRDASTFLRVLGDDGTSVLIDVDDQVSTVEVGDNAEYETTALRFTYESMSTPSSVYDHDLASGARTLRKRQTVLGDFDPGDYVQERLWARAADGVDVPISTVRHRATPVDGTAPGLLYGYGAYEISSDPWFSPLRLPLLDRGFVFAIAHVRGGGERGRAWYDDGKLLAKPHTFSDFVACADHIVAAGLVAPDRLAARGASAGGLLMGAVANLAPQRFRAILAEVPFVDALSTILDPSLPLTVTEWEEWGNPIESAEVYACMKSYAPYENVAPVAYPAIMATAGLNDPRVGYHEPAKWVARLREISTGGAPILLKTELGSGHGGPSGRYDAWRDQASLQAFLIDQLEAPAEPLR